MKIGLRYDMRAPDLGSGSASPRDLYRAAVEQCLWADKKGFNTVYLAEHHGAEDNYCPSPLILAAAIAGATEQIELHFSALCVTMHDPLRLAEDLAVLDLIAGPGRVLVTAGIGYRPEEFDMFGVDFPNRGKVFEDKLEVLRAAWRGAEFDYRGTRVRVTPVPGTPGGPTLYIGGNAKPSARRAARMGLGYRPATEDLYRFYVEECVRLGHPEPEPFPRHGPAFLYVAEDPEQALEQVAPHVIYASNMYASWAGERANATTNGYWAQKSDLDSIRNDPSMWIVSPDEAVRRLSELDDGYELRVHSLLGGLSPELSWRSLELLVDKVLPHVRSAQPVS
ncbi:MULTISPECIES: LLM class flavin-dependent oxidoreductase [Gordonia]|uniref:LLM class flavin-dependent oxidoreductase n=1 Tax=Gordonia amicalis TaxID=89053 RepID=A0AAE4R2Q3_9ACTN|nr:MULTISPECIES: LLM class flavin-dependent oxidoreductase [Gordonia]MCZ4577764.1 LLM class flavin-dependent oxidoreductase [Gordonia amicalis]MCZ4651394.1 LLM class flavin-dependent oxidoreductase [Gordonia amicalis]MDJ0451241.1 LLM class flavin-dependent oxidoreductase [Gordonia amicalis]MDV6310588.1 LLM class flavin-dependent oxidoreductase [Gordonia amicalis]MDV7074623.1 LLM class flavin-dependent oxidoreductase [Gordonia amicalis]